MHNGKVFLKSNPLVWLLAAAIFFRLTSLFLTPMVNPDSCRYINAAHQFLSGNFNLGLSQAGSLPTYPWLLITSHFVVPDWVLSGQLLSALCLILAVVPLYLLTRDLFGTDAALWGGLAFVLSPELNKFAGEIIREPPFALAFLWTAYFARKAFADARPGDFLTVSVLALIAISLRFEMVVFFFGFPLVLVFFALRDRLRRAAWLKGLAIFIAVPAALLLAMLPLLYAGSPDIRLGGGVNAFLAGLRHFDLMGTYPTVYAQLAAVEPGFPDAKFAHDAIETTRHLLPLVYLLGLLDALIASMSPLFAVLVVWGLIRRPQGGRAAGRPLLFLAGVFLLAIYFVLLNRNFISDRYLLAPMLLLLPWVGWGMCSLLEQLGRFRLARQWAACAIALFVVVPAADTIGNWEKGSGVQAVAGQWLKDTHAKPDTRLLVNDERIPLFAGYWMGEYLPYDGSSFESLERYALDNGRNLIAIRTSKKKSPGIPEMKHFKLLRKFEDRGAVVNYYGTAN